MPRKNEVVTLLIMPRKNEVVTVALNSDRVHISMAGTPMETILFCTYSDRDQDGSDIATGIAVKKAITLNKGSVTVFDKSK